MCYGSVGHHWGHHPGGFCGCHPHFHSGPGEFWTKKEKSACLERYLESLRDEVRAVEKTIAELKEEK